MRLREIVARVLLVFAGLIPLILFIGCSSTRGVPMSDHYDGHKFFNPHHPKQHGLKDMFKLLTSYSAKNWPKNLENQHVPSLPRSVNKGEAVVTFVNHATLLIQLNGLNLLTDPVWSKRVSPLSWVGPKRVRPPGLAIEALPKIDLILISHNHYDHMDLNTLDRLWEQHEPLVLVPIGDRQRLLDRGIKNVIEMDWWQTVDIKAGYKVTMTPTQHFSSRGLFDRNKSLWGSFMVHNGSSNLYFGGDSGYSPYYKEISERLGVTDLAFIPIGAYEPRWFMKPVHMNPEEAVDAHLDLKSRQSIGIHFGTFQLTEEAIDQPIKDLRQTLEKKKLFKNEFEVLAEGETRTFQLQEAPTKK